MSFERRFRDVRRRSARRLEDDEHHIDISWNEVWTGTTVIREIKKEGDKLVYTSAAAPFAGDGKMSVVGEG
jgi:hypothetical protein